MAKRVRVEQIVSIIEQRVRFGDYAVRQMPSEYALAAEVGSSRLTARKAVLRLLAQGVLSRDTQGRIHVNRTEGKGKRKLQIGVLSPAWVSMETSRYRVALDCLAARFGLSIRSMEFLHWEDAIFSEALASFDGLFIHPAASQMPASLVDRIRDSSLPVVVLGHDLSGEGIPSIDLCPPESFLHVFEHFHALGHRKLTCLNTQPVDQVIARRIEQWEMWKAARRIEGELINAPVQQYHDPARGAYDAVRQLLAAGSFHHRAIFCTTSPAAEGAMRALYEAKLQIGYDVAISGADDSEGRAWVCCPSLTVLQPPNPEPYLAVCLEWMARQGRDWKGPLLMVPADVPLFVGESTGNRC